MPCSVAPRTAAAGAPVPMVSHCWPTPLQETLRAHRQVWLSLLCGSLLLSQGPGAHTVLFVPFKSLWWVWGLILILLHPSYHLVAASPLSLDVGNLFLCVGSNILLSMVVQQIVAILVFSQMMSTRPTLPSSMAGQPKVLYCFLLYGSVAILVSASYNFITKTLWYKDKFLVIKKIFP